MRLRCAGLLPNKRQQRHVVFFIGLKTFYPCSTCFIRVLLISMCYLWLLLLAETRISTMFPRLSVDNLNNFARSFRTDNLIICYFVITITRQVTHAAHHIYKLIQKKNNMNFQTGKQSSSSSLLIFTRTIQMHRLRNNS